MSYSGSLNSSATENLKYQEKVNLSSFELLKVLGKGGMAKVYLVRKRMGTNVGRLYAMKVIGKVGMVKNEKRKERAKMERHVFEAVRGCPFLVHLHYAFQDEGFLYLILDYIQGGELFSHSCLRDTFEEDEVRIYIGELIIAIEQLHKMDIAYRDLKLENILIDKEGHILLTDFGLCKRFRKCVRNGIERTNSYCGTIQYMAPEVVNDMSLGHDMAVDWWGIGVLTFELLTGLTPFEVECTDNMDAQISQRILDKIPEIPDTFSPNVRDFIRRCLIKNPRQRLGGGPRDAAEVKEHPFFTEAPSQFNWKALINRQLPPPFVPELGDEMDTRYFDEEYTNMEPVIDCSVDVNQPFEGYSYIAPVLKVDAISKTTTDSSAATSNFDEDGKQKSNFFEIYEVDPNEDCLGEGSYSICRRCVHRETGREYAVKIIEHRNENVSEVNSLRVCQGHPNIVELIDVHEDDTNTYIVMELLTGGELLSRIRTKSFSESQTRVIIQQLSSAVDFMHSRGIVHRDIKPENLVFANWKDDSTVKLVDFGFATQKPTGIPLYTPCYTLPYAAPEVLAGDGYDEGCDLWNIGAVMFTMLYSMQVFHSRHDDLATKISSGEVNFDSKQIQSKITALGREVLRRLLTIEPQDRFMTSELMAHSWLTTGQPVSTQERGNCLKFREDDRSERSIRCTFSSGSSSMIVSEQREHYPSDSEWDDLDPANTLLLYDDDDFTIEDDVKTACNSGPTKRKLEGIRISLDDSFKKLAKVMKYSNHN